MALLFSVDAFPRALQRQLKRGTLRRWLLRRFYVAGRRDGRYIRDGEPVASYLRWGVALVQSHLLEELQREVAGPRASAQATKERIRLLEEKVARQDRKLESLSAGDEHEESMRVLVEGRRRSMLEVISLEQAALFQALARVDSAERICSQQVLTSQETGSLLWSRYRTGYVHGLVARREDPRFAPSEELEFPWPGELRRTDETQIVDVGAEGALAGEAPWQ